MTLTIHEQLRRLADTLRNEVGPAVGDEYTRTQAFMSSVILQRLANQVEHGPRHADAEAGEVAALHERLAPVLANGPDRVTAAAALAAETGTIAALAPLIRELHSWDDSAAADALALIRPALRADIDRRMEIAT